MHERWKVPVLLIIFNRPDTTKIVFEAIRIYKRRWASWRRGWSSYNTANARQNVEKVVKMFSQWFNWPESWVAARHFRQESKTLFGGNYAWDATCRANSMLTVGPNSNLVKNIGFGHAKSSHITNRNSEIESLHYGKLNFPISEPLFIHCDVDEDRRMSRWIMRNKFKSFTKRILHLG